jgi:hypothetical protein
LIDPARILKTFTHTTHLYIGLICSRQEAQTL